MTEDDPPIKRRDAEDARISGIAMLGEPVRRALYRYVVAQHAPVSRDAAAGGVGVARHVAKFHLDKLAHDGLLDVEFRRPAGRGGPGAGRPTKLYRRSTHEVAVSLPDRRYDLASWLLARAVTDADRDRIPVVEALARAAREAGRSLGQQARARVGPDPSAMRLASELTETLEDLGYEPHAGANNITLVNCPFHALAADYTDLVCAMNLELMTGLLDGAAPVGLSAYLEPTEGTCCVRLRNQAR